MENKALSSQGLKRFMYHFTCVPVYIHTMQRLIFYYFPYPNLHVKVLHQLYIHSHCHSTATQCKLAVGQEN